MSSDFKIKVNEVRNRTDDIVKCVDKLNNIISSAESIKNRLQIYQVYSSLQDTINILNSEKEKMMTMHIKLHLILSKYDNTESRIKNNANVISNVKKPNGNEIEGVNPNKNLAEDSLGGAYNEGLKENPAQEDLIKDIKDNSIGKDAVIDVIKEATGPIGNFIDLPGTFEEGNVGEIIGSVIGTGLDVIEHFKGTDTKWADWFNLGAYENKPLGDFFDISDTRAKISTACNWAVAILENVSENLEEHSGLTGRAFEEAIVETGIKIGEDILIKAGVGAILALAEISAPVWVVGGIVVGATIAVDALLDSGVKATKGVEISWIEVASDCVCDAVEESIESKRTENSYMETTSINNRSSIAGFGTINIG